MRVARASPISKERLSSARHWQTERGISPLADESWLELACHDDAYFAPAEGLLVIAVPPCEVTVGDLLDAGDTGSLGIVLPSIDSRSVPVTQAIAVHVNRTKDGWQLSCPGSPTGTELFSAEPALAFAQALRAFMWTHPIGDTFVQGFPEHGLVNFTAASGSIVHHAAIPVARSVDFSFWLPSGPPLIDHFRREARLSLSWLPTGSLAWRAGEMEQITRMSGTGAPPIPESQPEYFAGREEPGVEAIRFNAGAELSREALSLITAGRADRRPVVLSVDGLRRLRIHPAGDESQMVFVDTPGLATQGGRRDIPIAIPYIVAISIDSALRETGLTLTVDAHRGLLTRDDGFAWLEWER